MSFGIQGLPVPTEYGGLGMDPLTTVAALERLGYACKDNGLLFSINAHSGQRSFRSSTTARRRKRKNTCPVFVTAHLSAATP